MAIILEPSAGNHWYNYKYILINIFLTLLNLTYNQLSAGGFCKTLDEDEGYYVVYHSCYFGLVVLYIIFLITGTIDNITCIIVTINRALSLPMNTKGRVVEQFTHIFPSLQATDWYWLHANDTVSLLSVHTDLSVCVCAYMCVTFPLVLYHCSCWSYVDWASLIVSWQLIL